MVSTQIGDLYHAKNTRRFERRKKNFWCSPRRRKTVNFLQSFLHLNVVQNSQKNVRVKSVKSLPISFWRNACISTERLLAIYTWAFWNHCMWKKCNSVRCWDVWNIICVILNCFRSSACWFCVILGIDFINIVQSVSILDSTYQKSERSRNEN